MEQHNDGPPRLIIVGGSDPPSPPQPEPVDAAADDVAPAVPASEMLARGRWQHPRLNGDLLDLRDLQTGEVGYVARIVVEVNVLGQEMQTDVITLPPELFSAEPRCITPEQAMFRALERADAIREEISKFVLSGGGAQGRNLMEAAAEEANRRLQAAPDPPLMNRRERRDQQRRRDRFGGPR